ncbi:MAG TPA: polysaccharide deacetylase family protein, partial [Acidimicrobiales bacterium]|nr:polysaccharide deacetylase family protein [Acidimicrobiales bacterium]
PAGEVGGPGLPPVVSHVATTDPVVFVTIDDGWDKDPTVLPFLAAHQIKVTAFLIGRIAIRTSPYWDSLVAQGGVVEDHTQTHPFLARRPLALQRAEICTPLDEDQRLFGRRPTLFRPPYGSMDHTTVVAAGECGLGAVVLWDAAVARGKLRRATAGPLRPGDIIILHWGPGLAGDLRALVAVLDQSGLHSAQLEDYLRPSPPAAVTS